MMTTTNPTWDDLIFASTECQAAGYTLGWDHGYTQSRRDAEDDTRAHTVAVAIARAGVDAIGILHARAAATDRPDRGPDNGEWAA